MNYNYYESTESAQPGDIIATCRFGQCEVIELADGLILVQNILTKELAHEFTCDCDLIKRAEVKPRNWVSVSQWFKDGPVTEVRHETEQDAKDVVDILIKEEKVFRAYYKKDLTKETNEVG